MSSSKNEISAKSPEISDFTPACWQAGSIKRLHRLKNVLKMEITFLIIFENPWLRLPDGRQGWQVCNQESVKVLFKPLQKII